MKGKFTIYGVDRAGIAWDECYTEFSDAALRVVRGLRKTHPSCIWGVWDTDDPEKGDIEGDIEDGDIR